MSELDKRTIDDLQGELDRLRKRAEVQELPITQIRRLQAIKVLLEWV